MSKGQATIYQTMRTCIAALWGSTTKLSNDFEGIGKNSRESRRCSMRSVVR
jgi:hypothetical protein